MRRSLSIAAALIMFASLAGIATLGKVMADDKPDYTNITPPDLEKQTPKGKLSNPYKDTQTDIVSQGESLFRSYSCSGCHGGSAGGGMVVVKMNGQKQITAVHIEPEVFGSKDQEMLQDLVRAAVNEASRRVDEELANQMKSLAGGIPGMAGLKIPGLF